MEPRTMYRIPDRSTVVVTKAGKLFELRREGLSCPPAPRTWDSIDTWLAEIGHATREQVVQETAAQRRAVVAERFKCARQNAKQSAKQRTAARWPDGDDRRTVALLHEKSTLWCALAPPSFVEHQCSMVDTTRAAAVTTHYTRLYNMCVDFAVGSAPWPADDADATFRRLHWYVKAASAVAAPAAATCAALRFRIADLGSAVRIISRVANSAHRGQKRVFSPSGHPMVWCMNKDGTMAPVHWNAELGILGTGLSATTMRVGASFAAIGLDPASLYTLDKVTCRLRPVTP